MHLKSYAKVNFYLKIGEKQENGYHTLHSLMQTVDLYDSLFVKEKPEYWGSKETVLAKGLNEKIKEAKEESVAIQIDCSDLSIPTKENLIYRVYEETREELPKIGFHIILEKRIPIQAGLGGGSSNGGEFLRFLGERYSLNKEKIQKRAQKLGSDLPFFLGGGGLAEVSGVGEKLKFYSGVSSGVSVLPASLFFPWSICIVDSGLRISTREAFRELDLYRRSEKFYGRGHESSHESIRNLVWAIQEKNIDWFCENLYNEFEEVIFSNYKVLRSIQEKLFLLGARGVLLSGSGSCLFGVFGKEKDAKQAQRKILELSDSYKSFFCRAISNKKEQKKEIE